MWLPRGAAIIDELEKLAKETEFAAGYQRVLTPHIARESLYRKSGHVPYYVESMFPPMELKEDVREDIRWTQARREREIQASRFKEKLKAKLGMPGRSDLELEHFIDKAYDEDKVLDDLLDDELRDQFARLETFAGLDAFFISLGRKADRYYLKAMNCPQHHKLFAALPRSYRDLPLRLPAERPD